MRTMRTRLVAWLLGGTLLLPLSFACALAQDAAPAPQASGSAAGDPTGVSAPAGGGLEEVVVTATHVSTGVNHVPITISAVTQSSLDKIGITDASQLAAAVPGLGTGGGVAGRQTFTIRGIGATSGGATTGVYLDDVPLTQYNGQGVDQNNGAPIPELFDLQRVEVLEGPQGTLYGGSSEGGTVRFITPKPSLTQDSGFTRLQVEDTDMGAPGYLLGVAGGGPIVRDENGFRLSFVEHKIGGWLDEYNPYTTGPRAGADIEPNSNWTQEFAGRAAFLFKLSDRATLELNYYHMQTFANNTGIFGPTEPLAPGATFTTGGACYNTTAAQVGHGAPPKVACPAAGSPLPAGVYQQPVQTQGPFPFLNGTDAAVNPYDNLGTLPSNTLTKLQVPWMTFTYDLGRIEVKSITSYVRDFTDGNSFDRDLGGRILGANEYPGTVDYPLNPALPDYSGALQSRNYGNTVTEEIRATDPGSADSRWSWIAGLYYSRSREGIAYQFDTDTSAATEFAYGISSDVYTGLPEYPTGRVATQITNTQEAAYGNVNFNVTRKLRLTAGLRLSSIELNFWESNVGQEAGYPVSAPSIALGSRHNVPVSPLATLQYNFTPDDMAYLTASKGFRAGGVNTPLVSDCNLPLSLYGLTVQDIPASFGPDEVWSYELGTKLRLLDNRMQLNLSAYWINWADMQTVIPVGAGCNTNFTQNAGKAVSRGLNLQLQYQPIDALNFNLSMSYDDAYYPDAVTGPQPLSGAPAAVVVSKGQKFNLAPFTGDLGVQYSFHLGGHANFVRTDWQYSGGYQAGAPFGLPSYTPYDNYPAWFLLNVRAGMSFHWGDVELYSTNALNRQAWKNPQNSAGQSAFGNADCLRSGGPSCSQFLIYSPFVTAEVPTPRVVGIQLNYYFQ